MPAPPHALFAHRPEELLDVLDQELGFLQRGEVAAAIDVGPAGDGVLPLGVAADTDVLGENYRAPRRPGGGGQPVDHHVGQQAVAVDDLLGQGRGWVASARALPSALSFMWDSPSA